jgi:beta-N-acetylhexosaminidase
MTKTLRETVGSLIVVGLAGTELTKLEGAWLKLMRPGGIILFRRNIADARQTRALLRDATDLCAANSIRCVDVEGGTVDRLRDALAPMPSVQVVARAERARVSKPDKRASSTSLSFEHGELVARGVKAFGFNTSLAPVIDLGLDLSAGVMGTRTADASAAAVVAYARAFLKGLERYDVVGCGKHFPGLGGGTLDSHLETPSIERTWDELWQEDLAPYRELRDEMPMVMVNHAAYPLTKGGKTPASASAYWITAVLRKRIGYRGIILSDDLEMGGILKFMPIEEASIEAMRAGSDLVEICHSPELSLRTYEALLSEGERSTAFRNMLEARSVKTTRWRKKVYAGGVEAALTARQFAALQTRVRRFSEAVAKAADAGSA